MRRSALLLVIGLLACGTTTTDPLLVSDAPPERSPVPNGPVEETKHSTVTDAPPVDLRLVFVHGVAGDDGAQKNAHVSLADLEKHVALRVNARAFNLRVATARVNLYTDEHGDLLSPGIDERKDGTGLPSAKAWRAQLVKKTDLAFPGANNIVFVGHSTGARVAAEVTADAAFGLRDRVAGVVTLHGMIDALGSGAYDFVGPVSFGTGCKLTQSEGWCDYAGKVSGVSALDWVARERHVLSLVGAGSCSPSAWTGDSDQLLPLAAQSSPWSPGLNLTPVQNGTYGPAHGTFYGKFCHSDVTNPNSPRHADSIDAVSEAIATWLFDKAPRVVATDTPDKAVEVPPLGAGLLSKPLTASSRCPVGEHSLGNPEVATVCRHPGHFNGADHPSFDTTFEGGDDCNGSVRVAHHHGGEEHAFRVWVKRESVPEGGGLLSTLR